VQLAEIVSAVRPLLDRALVATDFDGTLAPLVLDPTTSRPVDGAIDALRALAGHGAQIAVITGRDAETVLRLGSLEDVPGLIVAGVYGVETWRDGELRTPDTPAAVVELRKRLPQAVQAAGDPDVWIEDKRLSLVVHTRRSADPAAALDALEVPVTEVGEALGFEVHRGSDVLELRLPGHDKAGALARLAEGHEAVVFLGDDLGDLPAFAEVRRLRAVGAVAYGIGVRSSGVAEIEGQADAYVDDPAAVVRFFRAVAGDSGQDPAASSASS
jgi:trehalose 6-phosphate phosphatase